jgi:hypothetical protein
VIGQVTGRAEAQARRLSVLYALLDRSPAIRREHLEAALALWDYIERSCRWIFGESTGNADADELLRALRAAGHEGLGRTEMSGVFGRNKTAGQIDHLLALLLEYSLVIPGKRASGGKPAEKWKAANLPPGARAPAHASEAGVVVQHYQKTVGPQQDAVGGEQAVRELLEVGYAADQLKRAADGYAAWCQQIGREGRYRLAARNFYAEGGRFQTYLAGPPDYLPMTPTEIWAAVKDLSPEARKAVYDTLPKETVEAVHDVRRGGDGHRGNGTKATNPTKAVATPGVR